MQLFPYQSEGVEWLKTHFRAILGDEPGLGKTVQAISLIRECPGIQRTLVVCPAAVKSVWINHAEGLSRQLLSARKETHVYDTEITVINYDILPHRINQLAGIPWDLVIFDEAHCLKNVESQRSAAAFGKLLKANRILFLTGTPMINRPVELWTLLYAIDRTRTGSFMEFTTRFCGGHYRDGVWEAKGAQNLTELNELLSLFMLRRYKKDVLPQLPPKIRTVIEAENPEEWISLKMEFGIEWKERIKEMKRTGSNPSQESMARMRRIDGIGKAPYAADYVQMRLDQDPESKIVVMAFHTDVIDFLVDFFGNKCVCLQGSTPPAMRPSVVEQFQENPRIRVFVGQIKAAGVGITLTAANRVVFAEQSWVPGDMDQAECRPHRIGQKDTVWSDWIVRRDSIDSIICPTILRKMEIIDKTVDGKNERINVADVVSEAIKLFS